MALILVIDDEEDFLRGVCRFLRGAGHEVEETADGAGAMEIVREHPLDLVVTDINMPDMDGIEVITTLRKAHPNVPVIAMSGGGKLPISLLLDSADMLGAISTISKPFELSELGAAVDAALGGGTPPAWSGHATAPVVS